MPRFYYRVTYFCHSLKPNKRSQEIASHKSEAGPELVAEARKLIADTFKRDTDEIEILSLYGITDPKQVWPKPAAGDGTGIDQGEGAGVDSNSLPLADPPAPKFKLPTLEVANSYQKQQFIELAGHLGVSLPDGIKYPDLRTTVLAALNAKWAENAAAMASI